MIEVEREKRKIAKKATRENEREREKRGESERAIRMLQNTKHRLKWQSEKQTITDKYTRSSRKRKTNNRDRVIYM